MNSRFCKVCSKWHDLDKDWPDACLGHYHQHGQTNSPQIIKDIEPYRAIATDIATGKPPAIGSRREHREFLKRNSYIEVGNDPCRPTPRQEIGSNKEAVRRAMSEVMRRK